MSFLPLRVVTSSLTYNFIVSVREHIAAEGPLTVRPDSHVHHSWHEVIERLVALECR